ncbi:MAG TPA: hypothetical protein VHU91_03975 [Mycobacteriales bacterium]|nr:hypothetical protein [Mycobacteriales bacterium]
MAAQARGEVGSAVKADVAIRIIEIRGASAEALLDLESHLGDRFVAGYVLYTGQQTLPFGEKLRAIPMEALWQLSP